MLYICLYVFVPNYSMLCYRSLFCLCPAGDTPSSARLFDAIVSGCIPVIVSDELELPFEGLLDYNKVFVKKEKKLLHLCLPHCFMKLSRICSNVCITIFVALISFSLFCLSGCCDCFF